MIILIGMLGIVVPVLPGLLLTLLGVLIWAIDMPGTTPWVIFGLCCVWFAAGLAGQYLIPGKRLKADGVRTGSLVIAALCGIAGMFLIPVVGFFVGFVLGLFVLAYLRDPSPWPPLTRTQRGVGGFYWPRSRRSHRSSSLCMNVEDPLGGVGPRPLARAAACAEASPSLTGVKA